MIGQYPQMVIGQQAMWMPSMQQHVVPMQMQMPGFPMMSAPQPMVYTQSVGVVDCVSQSQPVQPLPSPQLPALMEAEQLSSSFDLDATVGDKFCSSHSGSSVSSPPTPSLSPTEPADSQSGDEAPKKKKKGPTRRGGRRQRRKEGMSFAKLSSMVDKIIDCDFDEE